MKKALVLGASGGIGRACVESLLRSPAAYEVSGVCRRNLEIPGMRAIQGDLCDSEFRRTLAIEQRAQVVIAAYGKFPSVQSSYTEVLNEFMFSVIDIYERFEATGELEKFVVVSSLSALTGGIPHHYLPSDRHMYNLSKRLLSDFFRQVQMYMKSKSEIILIEPGFVHTDFADISRRIERAHPDDVISRLDLVPIDPKLIADEIRRSLESDLGRTSAMTFFNRSNPPAF